MADNVAITAGSGVLVAADEVVDGTLGTVEVQYVKLMDGTLNGTSKATVGANGLSVAEADGANVALGTKADTLLLTGSASTIALLKGLISLFPQSLGQKTMAGSVGVVLPSDQAIIPASLGASVTIGTGLSTYFNNALLATVTSVKASAGKVIGWSFYNSNAVDVWVQMWDLATGSVTIGTTAPKKTIWVPSGGSSDYQTTIGINHATAISIAATTTSNGSTAPGVGIITNVDYI